MRNLVLWILGLTALGTGIAVAATDMTLLQALLVWVAVLPAVDWLVAIYLARLAWIKPRIPALTDRAVTAIAVSVTATIAAVLGANRLTHCECIPGSAVGFLLVGGMLLISLPAIYWVHLYRSGRFGQGT